MAIIVGVDGSEESQRALEWAVEEARLREDSVVALMAHSVPPTYVFADLPGAMDSQMREEMRRASEEELHQAVERAASDGVEVSEELTEHEQPARLLTERASSRDLLVVGSRGRGGFKGLLLGSVSQQCIQHAPCPVVIVRAET